MARVFELANVFELVMDGFDSHPFAEQNFIPEREQTRPHIFFEFGDELDSLVPKLREESLGNGAAIANEFAEHLSGRRCQEGRRMHRGGGVAVR